MESVWGKWGHEVLILRVGFVIKMLTGTRVEEGLISPCHNSKTKKQARFARLRSPHMNRIASGETYLPP